MADRTILRSRSQVRRDHLRPEQRTDDQLVRPGFPVRGDARIDLGEVLLLELGHVLLQPLGDRGAVEAELPPHLLTGNLPRLGHTFQPAWLGPEHAGQFLECHASVRHRGVFGNRSPSLDA